MKPRSKHAEITYTVRGQWQFPLDMLRRDMSMPVYSDDSDTMMMLVDGSMPPETKGEKFEINLSIANNGKWKTDHERQRFMPNIERWKSFRWEVIKIDGEPISEAEKPDHIPHYIRKQSELAHTYAEDGAYVSAHRVLAELTEEVRKHAEKVILAEKRLHST